MVIHVAKDVARKIRAELLGSYRGLVNLQNVCGAALVMFLVKGSTYDINAAKRPVVAVAIP